jgi:putative transcriptional regulator
MTIAHHPPEELLAAFAAGTLDAGEHLVVAVHAAGCASCRRFVRAVEGLGGAALERAEPAAMSAGSFETVLARIDGAAAAKSAAASPGPGNLADDDLPPILRTYRIGSRRWVAPGVSLHPIRLPDGGQSRAFLLRSGPGTRLLEHSHTGTELTCVLKGSFSHDGGRFGPGDFDFGDGTVDHQPVVGNEEPCLCLVAMTGDLRLKGFFGRLISPFVRL